MSLRHNGCVDQSPYARALVQMADAEFDLPSAIQAAALTAPTQAVVLTCSGEVVLCDLESSDHTTLSTTSENFVYTDGGFDPTAASSIYTMDDIIVVVNDYLRHGFVFNPTHGYRLHLQRGSYHADISRYPIAMFHGKDGDPCLIYGTDWNRVDIANLATRQVLTADKSLIEVGAEQRHLDFYAHHDESNKLLWPRGFDYFFGHLSISPDQTRFMSVGWVWGSADSCMVFDIGDFLSNHRVNACTVGVWEHESRAMCWVDEDTVAAAVNPSVEYDFDPDEDDAGVGPQVPEDVWQIRLYHADSSNLSATIALDQPLNLTRATLAYQAGQDRFIAFSDTLGLAAIGRDGHVELYDPAFSPNYYDQASQQFIRHTGTRITLYTIT